VIRAGLRKRSEAGQDQFFSGPGTAKDVAARLTALRYDALHGLAEVVDAVDADSDEEG
jgi:hypothetical protein